MPWNAATFSQRHNKALHGEKAAHAARIANAVLRSGQPDGLAIAVANKWAKAHRRADGGATPSYLAGTAGSPINPGVIPKFVAAQPAINPIWPSSGLMNTPQTGSYYLDPQTGALSGASQQALQALAQRGLSIGGPQGAGPGAGPGPGAGAGQQPPGGPGFLGTEGAGNAGNGVDVNVSGGGGGSSGGGGGGGGSGGFGGFGGALTSGVNSKDLSFGPSINTQNIPGDILQALGAVGGGAVGAVAGPFGSLAGSYGGGKLGAAGAHAVGLPTGSVFEAGHDVVGMGPGNLDTTGPNGGLVEMPGGGLAEVGNVTGPNNAAGGRIERAAGGGLSPSQESPWFVRAEARAGEHPSGLVVSPIGGRSDHIPLDLPPKSYVMPADIIGGMGQGNTIAGSHQFDKMLASGPYGSKLPMPRLHGTLPKPPGMPKMLGAQHFSRGGRTKGMVPVIVAGGERILSPADVARLSGGDLERGHAMLDKFVVEARKHIVKHTQALPGPVK